MVLLPLLGAFLMQPAALWRLDRQTDQSKRKSIEIQLFLSEQSVRLSENKVKSIGI